jgi:PAS domain S-box-containing protein
MASTALDKPVSPKAMIRLLDYAFEHAPIAIVDSTGRILRANARLMGLFGLTAEALHLVSIRDMTHPDDLPRDLTLAAEIIDGKRDSYTVEKRYFRPDGSLIQARTTVIAMTIRTGVAFGMFPRSKTSLRSCARSRSLQRGRLISSWRWRLSAAVSGTWMWHRRNSRHPIGWLSS